MAGKEIRLKRLFKSSDRIIIVPMDHGVTAGPIEGIEDVPKTVRFITQGKADAIVLHKGLVPQVSHLLGASQCELILHLSASSNISPDSQRKELVSTVEHAIRLGATAVSIHVNLGNPSESHMLRDFGRISEDCQRWGIPLLAMMYVRDGSAGSEFDPGKVKHAARIAQELGADIIKVNYTGSIESFWEVTRGVKVPVVIAGGPKTSTVAQLLFMVYDALQAGAQGISIGRNIFQAPDPAQLLSTIRLITDSQITRDKLEELTQALVQGSRIP
ncbi:2-amino-3,7-dideoxy-D-threo-hept-6-ulosonate synthase [Desulfitobacterium dichloroeliminans LMG P-21439]|uniref:2-amino-3,7-dideoxy-D-threo-hept-6-ulosonate synthase n=1 Tax=Desulfitobacterium dichloroeliminans (strain LMG P-21439 / DCA1) TaxID=871963 RepID=L0FCS2_DESDL|nr:2-amino-3,7-dideoxy-D-threo-hept-6-ulosonate synthase [Desulfitobacterium dichloroeliminans]AGA70456.1 2-amino-3,7-dideoxy-D-threo-hept-6-ulosonate synthase [Desulfitobacterium dichloroeliminans LMG P-21439]